MKKTKDYGTAWRGLRTISVVDQIFIKALRIRTIQDIKTQKIGDDIASEFKGTNQEIEDLRSIMFDTDSMINENLGDLDDRFFTYRSTSKNNIKRLQKENKSLKERIDELEIKLNELESSTKKDKDE